MELYEICINAGAIVLFLAGAFNFGNADTFTYVSLTTKVCVYFAHLLALVACFMSMPFGPAFIFFCYLFVWFLGFVHHDEIIEDLESKMSETEGEE